MTSYFDAVARRRTFAIIAHPDAGKTTLTEKLLLFGGAIQQAGAVKAKGERRRARSDWMKVEQERGISVASSVMTFDYEGRVFNLLDTPGHEDFSEDTYRTLSAVDSAVMVLDAAKGIETQTRKLFEVCRLRDVPIITFINKLDREGREPFDLLDEIDREYQRQIHRLISHDDLTGLLSSRSFFSELRREAGRATAENRPFCVLMMDGDNFKGVNDTYGHLTGSKTIEEIGFSIMTNLRSGDAAARFGGDEFAAFLLDADLPQALTAAERMRSSVECYDFSVLRQGRAKETHHITVSIGVASFPEDSSDPIELVEMADSALYRAKREGRNRVAAYRNMTHEEIHRHLPPRRS